MEEEVRRPALLEVLRARVELWVAVVLMALAFGGGFAVSHFFASGPRAPAAGAGVARPLTPEDLERGLPPGHPPIEGLLGPGMASPPAAGTSSPSPSPGR